MNREIYDKKQMEELLKNKNVKKINGKGINYSNEFKIKAVKLYEEGMLPREIFERAGFNIDILGEKIARDSLFSWRKIAGNKGIDFLKEEKRGKKRKGRTKKIENMSDKEKIERLMAENAYLKEENDFLVKLRAKRNF